MTKAQQEQVQAQAQEITMPEGYSLAKTLGRDEIADLIKRAGIEVEYEDMKENPARALSKTPGMRRFVCSVLVKFPSRAASFIIGNSQAPLIVKAENIEADYLKFTKIFEAQSKNVCMLQVATRHYIRQDGSTFRRAKVSLLKEAPIFAKEA